jgi:hypothetical protein
MSDLTPPRSEGAETPQLARRIAERLFNVGKDVPHAQRLVLTIDTPSPRNLGGWAFEPAVREIERGLREAMPPVEAAPRVSPQDTLRELEAWLVEECRAERKIEIPEDRRYWDGWRGALYNTKNRVSELISALAVTEGRGRAQEEEEEDEARVDKGTLSEGLDLPRRNDGDTSTLEAARIMRAALFRLTSFSHSYIHRSAWGEYIAHEYRDGDRHDHDVRALSRAAGAQR